MARRTRKTVAPAEFEESERLRDSVGGAAYCPQCGRWAWLDGLGECMAGHGYVDDPARIFPMEREGLSDVYKWYADKSGLDFRESMANSSVTVFVLVDRPTADALERAGIGSMDQLLGTPVPLESLEGIGPKTAAAVWSCVWGHGLAVEFWIRLDDAFNAYRAVLDDAIEYPSLVTLAVRGCLRELASSAAVLAEVCRASEVSLICSLSEPLSQVASASAAAADDYNPAGSAHIVALELGWTEYVSRVGALRKAN